jgi:hypothetical protein
MRKIISPPFAAFFPLYFVSRDCHHCHRKKKSRHLNFVPRKTGYIFLRKVTLSSLPLPRLIVLFFFSFLSFRRRLSLSHSRSPSLPFFPLGSESHSLLWFRTQNFSKYHTSRSTSRGIVTRSTSPRLRLRRESPFYFSCFGLHVQCTELSIYNMCHNARVMFESIVFFTLRMF